MAQVTMYNPQVNSPATSLAGAITDSQTSITVADGAVLPAAPNLLTIGSESTAETVLMTAKNGNTLTVTRGYQGTKRSWAGGTMVARMWTAADHKALIDNINDLNNALAEKQDAIELSGILKGNGTDVGTATAGTDYSVPAAELTATLTVAGWTGTGPYTQTVDVMGIVLSGYNWFVSPADASYDAWMENNVHMIKPTVADKATFNADQIPSAALTVNIMKVQVAS